MARIIEIFVLVNAVAGIATFLGVRFVWRFSKNKAKRGFQIVHADKEQCPICELSFPEDEMFMHLHQEHPAELAVAEERWKKEGRLPNSEKKLDMHSLPSGRS